MAQETKSSVIVLLEESPGKARIQMRDGDDFYIAIADAARACRSFDDMRHFGGQMKDLLEALTQWVAVHKDPIKSAYVTFREQGMLFVVVQKHEQFDQALSDDMTDLDLSIANDARLNLITLDVLALPSVSAESATAFLSSGPVYTYA